MNDDKMSIPYIAFEGELEELMEKAPDEQTKKEFRKFIAKMQSM